MAWSPLILLFVDAAQKAVSVLHDCPMPPVGNGREGWPDRSVCWKKEDKMPSCIVSVYLLLYAFVKPQNLPGNLVFPTTDKCPVFRPDASCVLV